MKNSKSVFNYIICVTIAFLALAGAFFLGNITATADPIEIETIKYVEVIGESNFDTSIIEKYWCGSYDDGTVRMVGAWYYADGVVEDEQGQLWGIDQQIDENDFLLLWIADNHTPNYTIDDIVIKVWREAY